MVLGPRRSTAGCVLTKNESLVEGMETRIVSVLVLQAVSLQVQRVVLVTQVTSGLVWNMFVRIATARVLPVQGLLLLSALPVMTKMHT